MLGKIQKRKLTMLFHRHDRNNDGFLTKADYEGFAKKICKLWKYAPGSPQYEATYAQNVAVWDYVQAVADKNKDGKVSLDEFLTSYDVTLSDPKLFDSMVVQYCTTMLKMGDVDGDGKLSGAEFVGFLQCYGLPKKEAQEAFRRLDVGGTGYLDIDETMKLAKEFYGDDPKAPGNWLFGPF